jgi:hypothetical protein
MQIPAKHSSDLAWIQFWKDLKRIFSKKEAQSWWVTFWNERAGVNSNANTSRLRLEMKSHGIEISAQNWIGSVGDAASSFAGGIGTFLKVGGVVVVCGAVLVGAFYLSNMTRNARN